MDTFWVITSYLTAFILLIVIPSARYYAETDEQKAFVNIFFCSSLDLIRNPDFGALPSTLVSSLLVLLCSSLSATMFSDMPIFQLSLKHSTKQILSIQTALLSILIHSSTIIPASKSFSTLI